MEERPGRVGHDVGDVLEEGPGDVEEGLVRAGHDSPHVEEGPGHAGLDAHRVNQGPGDGGRSRVDRGQPVARDGHTGIPRGEPRGSDIAASSSRPASSASPRLPPLPGDPRASLASMGRERREQRERRVRAVRTETSRLRPLDDPARTPQVSHGGVMVLSAPERITRLIEVAAALSKTMTPEQVADVVPRRTAGRARRGRALLRLDDEAGDYVLPRRPPTDDGLWSVVRLALTADRPIVVCARTGRAIATGPESRCMPLLIRGHAIGALELEFGPGEPLGPEALAFLEATVEQCAQALERARLYALDQIRREELEHSNRMKDDFLGIVSHELRTPLSAILGWARMLKRGMLTSPRARERALEAIERNASLQGAPGRRPARRVADRQRKTGARDGAGRPRGDRRRGHLETPGALHSIWLAEEIEVFTWAPRGRARPRCSETAFGSSR